MRCAWPSRPCGSDMRGSLALVLMLVGCGPEHAPEVPRTKPSAVDSVIDAHKDFAGVVMVADATTIRYETARGFADPKRGIPHDTKEVWRWASVTKQVTALFVMQDVEAGKLSLDTKLHAVLPDFKGPTADSITIRDLLQHTSGLPKPLESDLAQGISYCEGAPRAPVGASFEYNNCDYLVLGRILGQSWDTRVRGLGLSSIGAPSPVVSFVDGKEEPPVDLASYGASGALTGTAADLVRFDRALLRRSLLGQAATDTMWEGDPKLGYVALGAWGFDATLRGCAQPVKLVERRGAIGGVQVRNILVPGHGLAIVIFTNDGNFDFGEIWQGNGFSHDVISAAVCTP